MDEEVEYRKGTRGSCWNQKPKAFPDETREIEMERERDGERKRRERKRCRERKKREKE